MMAPSRYVESLQETDPRDLAHAGGKGAFLGEMIRGGLPVPNGFLVRTDAYRKFVEVHGLWPDIERLVMSLNAGDTTAIEDASAAIAKLFERSPVPEEIVSELVSAYDQLGGIPLAVRSSATAEDLPGASFAGQHNTDLNVRGPTNVVEAVRRCWASLWTSRAISYRLQQGIPHENVAIAVVVQELIEGNRSGVLFTANPATGRRDQILINASWGLGEAIVGGAVTPDQWVIDKESGRILETKIARKLVMTIRREEGTAMVDVPPDRQQTAVLAESEVGELATLARKAEAHFGQPQDIEWVWGDGNCYFVQSRPITSLFPLPEPLPVPGEGLRIYLCGNQVGQTMAQPWTPMALDFFKRMYAGVSTIATGQRASIYPSWAKTAAGRFYFDLTDLLRDRKRWPLMALRISWADPIAARAFSKLMERNADLILARKRGPNLFWPLVRLLPGFLGRVFYAFITPRGAMEKAIDSADEEVRRLELAAERLRTVDERLRFVEESATATFQLIMKQVALILPGFVAAEAAKLLMQRWLGEVERLQPVRQSLPYNPTTEMGLSLLRIADTLKIQGKQPSTQSPEVKEFLRIYGHRAVREIDLGVPRWQDDPSYVIDILLSYMEGEPADRIREFHERAARADEAVEEIVSQVRRRKGEFHAWLVERLLRTYRIQGGLRERPKFDLLRVFTIIRRVLREVGAELVNQDRLYRADDVFFVTYAGIESGADLRPVVAENRAEYERELRRLAVPRLMTSTGESIYSAEEENAAGALRGTPVSPGIYEGRVRVLSDPKGAKLEAGEVLVAHGTDPAWTPLFLKAGALVMETGGPISHGAIVAREYGIPAIAGLDGATTRLRDGQRVRVNGESGEVVPLEY